MEPVTKKGSFLLTRRDLIKAFFLGAIPFQLPKITKVYPGQVIYISTKACPPFDGIVIQGGHKVSNLEWRCLDMIFTRIVKIRVPVPEEVDSLRVLLASNGKTVFEGCMEVNRFYFGF